VKTATTNGRPVAHIGGKATITVNMHGEALQGGLSDPADIYAEYVRQQVRMIKDLTGETPSEITVFLERVEE
jgi:hypothetical protein